MDRHELLKRMAERGTRPFQNEVTKSPWDPVIDVEGLNRAVKDKVIGLARECPDPRSPRCLVIKAAPGLGKTHLLACVRRQLEERGDAGFVYVPPYRLVDGSVEGHLLTSVADSLFRYSLPARKRLETNVLALLVHTYNQLVKTSSGRAMLEVQLTLWQRLQGEDRAIHDHTADEQLNLLRPHLHRGEFLERAFTQFRAAQSADLPAGASLDRDVFLASCLLALGSSEQRWAAERWFRNQPLQPEEQRQLHVTGPVESVPRIKDALATVGRLLDRPLCLCFDQMEDTLRSFEESRALDDKLFHFAHTIEAFYTVPGVCFVFCVQESVWEAVLSKRTPSHFVRRMTEGHGPQNLDDLTLETARELVVRRLAVDVWQPLGLKPPPDEPAFPFDDASLKALVRESRGAVYTFLQLARQHYTRRLEASPFRLLSISPDHGVSEGGYPVEIRGENVPPQVTVSFGGIAVEAVVSGPDAIRLTVPAGAPGPAMVRVAPVPADGRAEEISFRYDGPPQPTTPREQTAGGKLKVARTKKGLTQADVAKQLGGDWTNNRVSAVERGVAPDWTHYQRLAEFFQIALEEAKTPPSNGTDGKSA